MKENNHKPKKNIHKNVWSGFAILVLIAISIASFNQFNEQKKLNDNQKLEISFLQKELNDLKNTETEDASADQTDYGFMDIKELSMKVKLSSATKDAYYAMRTVTNDDGSTSQIADVFLKSLDTYPTCNPNSGNYTSIGGFTDTGKYSEPQATCDSTPESVQIQLDAVKAFSSAEIEKY